MRNKFPLKRKSQITELGLEIECRKCLEFWPATKEFYFKCNKKYNPFKLMYWCRDCLMSYRLGHKYPSDNRKSHKRKGELNESKA